MDDDDDDAFVGRRGVAHVPATRTDPRPSQQQEYDYVDVISDEEGSEAAAADGLQRDTNNTNDNAGRCALVAEYLHTLGVWPRADWLASCMDALAASQPGFGAMSVSAQAEKCFLQFLSADLNVVGDAALPANVHSLHATELSGPFVLQVDEIVDISSCMRDRYQERSAGLGKRCLKLSMTDGVQRVFGIEYRAMPDLQVFSPAGLKVVIRNVLIRRGLFMLVPEVLNVLGGLVEPLEEARARMVHQVNKAPRGNRARQGSIILKLAEKATNAAWPSEVSNAATSGAQSFNNEQGSAPVGHSFPGREQHQLPFLSTGRHGPASVHRDAEEGPESSPCDHEKEALQDSGAFRDRFQASLCHADQATPSQGVPKSFERMQASSMSRLSLSARRGFHFKESGRQDLGSIQAPIPFADNVDCWTIPFTYLALLKERASSTDDGLVRGKIKCVTIGVKEFHFKDRQEFDLVVHIDDGSLLVEARIDHQVVQDLVGYSPMDVNAALSGFDRQKMREVMYKFQLLLTNFEGYMDLEFRSSCVTPVVVALSEALENSNACLLLERVQRSINSTNA
ncbi:hypothetical protein O6H91_18G025400 [Diphasiastrum complanatum]|uniref:Uncharacterized protein n=2 Tax=Diphasiastrum complanatum TaxID=34168 RepID=A0ACC2AZ30_DIPCM|nr:hypothetical protein O6H91_18G025400 [Diphasiastrum complanatum]KAJ7522760.1 hypothetical protein O6H91_18G025400 [Diphasiastrum complanatum]